MKYNGNAGTPPSPVEQSAGENFSSPTSPAGRDTRFSIEATEHSLLLREVKKLARWVIELEVKIEEIEKEVEGIRQANKKQEMSQEDYNLFKTMEKHTVKQYLHQLLHEDDNTIMDVYNNLARVREAHKNTNMLPLKESQEVNAVIDLKPTIKPL